MAGQYYTRNALSYIIVLIIRFSFLILRHSFIDAANLVPSVKARQLTAPAQCLNVSQHDFSSFLFAMIAAHICYMKCR